MIVERLPEIEPKSIHEIGLWYDKARILFVALEYMIFTLLTEPKSAKQISEEIKTDFYLTEKFLNVLVAFGFLSKTAKKYCNSQVSDIFLTKGKPFYQGTALAMKKRGVKDWLMIYHALKNGSAQKKTEKTDYRYIDRVFIVGHAECAITGAMQKAVNAVSRLPEFHNAGRILDLGGGHGLYSIAFAQLKPELEVTLFDLPHVTQIAQEYFSEYYMEDTIKTISGDFTKDSIGTGYDIVFVSDVTIDDAMLKKIHEALNDNGILIYRRWVIDEDGTSPLVSVLFDFMLAVRNSDHKVHTLNEYSNMLENGDFNISQVIDISSSADPTKLIIAKKEG